MTPSPNIKEAQQKLQSTIGLNAKNLKHGIRTVMAANRLGGIHGITASGKRPMGPAHREDLASGEGEHAEQEEISVEELATIPRVIEDTREASMELSESASQLRTSNHTKQRNLKSQDSPRGPEEWLGSGNTATTATLSSQGPSLVGSDSNLLGQHSFPMSPVAGSSPNEKSTDHPQSAPNQLQSGPSPISSQHQLKGKFLRGKIKIAALKNFVGGGLDLSSTSHNAQAAAEKKTRHQSSAAGTGEENVVNHRRRPRPPLDGSNPQELSDEEDEDFASPQPVRGPGTKIARRMKQSILGLTNLAAKAGRNNNAVLLGDDTTESTEGAGGDGTKPTRPRSPRPDGFDRRVTTDEMIEQGVAQNLNTSMHIFQEKEEAKRQRRVKHKERVAKRLDEQNHQTATPATKEEAPKSPRKMTASTRSRAKLDPEARERLKKHSERNELRNRAEASRRRRLALSKRDSERSNAFSVNTAVLTLATEDEPKQQQQQGESVKLKEELSPTPTKESHKSLASLRSRNLGESQTSRKQKKKEEDEKLRERVRNRQSFVMQNAPTKEPSISLLELEDKDDDASFAEDLAESVAPVDDEHGTKKAASSIPGETKEASLQDIFGPEIPGKSAGGSGYLADASTMAGSTSLNASGGNLSLGASSRLSLQGSSQRVASSLSNEYWQLRIDGVPMKADSPPPQEDGTTTETAVASTDAANVITTEKTVAAKSVRKMARKGSKTKLVDSSLDISESETKVSRSGGNISQAKDAMGSSVSRKHKSHRVRSDKKEGNRRSSEEKEGKRERSKSRKARAEKSSLRHHSPHRHSEHSSTRRRKHATRHAAGHASAHSASLNEGDAPANVEMSLTGESSQNLNSSSTKSHLHGSSSSYLDASSQGIHDKEANKEHSERKERDETKERKRREKRTDRKENRAMNASVSASKHSLENSSGAKSGPDKPRSTRRGRSEEEKKAPSRRGRSEAKREINRANEKSARRHSLDAKKRAAGEASKQDLGKSLANIKW